jgi:DNA-directed RNA polymerase subunit M/transcription elongation factor TFIIS
MAMMILCPSCETKLSVPETAVGKKVACPKCSTKFLIEAPAEDDGGFEVIEPKKKPEDDFEVIDDAPPKKTSKSSLAKNDEPKPAKRVRFETDEPEEDVRTSTRLKKRKRDYDDDDDDGDEEDMGASVYGKRKKRKPPAKDNTGKYALFGGIGLIIVLCAGCSGWFALQVRNAGNQFNQNFAQAMKDLEKNQVKPGSDGWADCSSVAGKYRVLLPGEGYLSESFEGSAPQPGSSYAMHTSHSEKLNMSGSVASFPAQTPKPNNETGYLELMKELDFEFDGASHKLESKKMIDVGTLQALVVRSKPRRNSEFDTDYRITVLIVTSARCYILSLSDEGKYPDEASIKKMLDSFQVK